MKTWRRCAPPFFFFLLSSKNLRGGGGVQTPPPSRARVNGVIYALHLLAKVHILDRKVLGGVLGSAREVIGLWSVPYFCMWVDSSVINRGNI